MYEDPSNSSQKIGLKDKSSLVPKKLKFMCIRDFQNVHGICVLGKVCMNFKNFCTTINLSLFFWQKRDSVIYWKVRMTHRETQRAKEIMQPLDCSNSCNSQGQARPKPGARNFPQEIWVAGVQVLELTYCLPGSLFSKLDQRRAAGTQTSTPVLDVEIVNSGLPTAPQHTPKYISWFHVSTKCLK